MKFYNNYIFYPDNNELVEAIDHYKTLSIDKGDIKDSLDQNVTVQDNFLHTRGNFEQQCFNTTILDFASDTFESEFTNTTKEDSPIEWAKLQNSLGNILSAQAQQRMDDALFENAISAFNHALEVFDQVNTPSQWASTHYNLGCATQALGKQQKNAKMLQISVDAFTDAFLVWTRALEPEKWAYTMFQLGMSLYEQGKLQKGNRNSQKSVVAFKNALLVFDADLHALELSATHNSRGVVLHNLAESEQNADRVEEALRSYQKALTVLMEQQKPFHLAVLCRVNIATAQLLLAELRKDMLLADEVVDEFELIIECFKHVLQPMCLKHCEEQLLKAQSMIG